MYTAMPNRIPSISPIDDLALIGDEFAPDLKLRKSRDYMYSGSLMTLVGLDGHEVGHIRHTTLMAMKAGLECNAAVN